MLPISANSNRETEPGLSRFCAPGAGRCLFRLVRLLVIGAVAGAGASISALEPATPVASYGRQAWLMENGLPQNTVQALVQSRDGFVWLGTEVGLVRFDGNGFQVFDRTSRPALPGNDIQCLLAASDASLWVGTSEGLARWKDGVFKTFGRADGLPGNDIRDVSETSAGVVWVWTDQGLARLIEERFVPSAEGLPGGAITSIFPDNQGGMWLATTKGAAVFRGGALRGGGWMEVGGGPPFGPFKVGPGPGSGVAVAENADVFDPVISGGSRLASAAELPQGGVEFMVALLGGGVVLSSKSALVVVTAGKAVARMAVGRELPGSRIQVLMTDRQGALWIGTNGGLARWAGENWSASRSRIRWPRRQCWR